MFYLRRTLRSTAVAGLLISAFSPARAELAATSPFLPPQSQIVAAPTAPPVLEFRGVTSIENTTIFSILDSSSAKRSSVWLKLNEAGPGFSVKKYEPDSDTITVDYQGRTLRLVMKTPKIAAAIPTLAAPPLPVPIVAQTPGAANLALRPLVPTPPTIASVVPNTTPAAEAARMKEWTDEIEKRRNARNTPAGAPGAAQPQTGPASAPQVIKSAPQAPPVRARP